MKPRWIAGAAAAAISVASLVPGPYHAAVEPVRGATFLEAAEIDSASVSALRRACRNCHSNDTEWPWYSRVAPASWLLRRDVSEGRKFLNFSVWSEYGAAGQSQLSALAAQRIKDGTMPPARYLLLHPDAKLSGRERARLAARLERESSRVAMSIQANR